MSSAIAQKPPSGAPRQNIEDLFERDFARSPLYPAPKDGVPDHRTYNQTFAENPPDAWFKSLYDEGLLAGMYRQGQLITAKAVLLHVCNSHNPRNLPLTTDLREAIFSQATQSFKQIRYLLALPQQSDGTKRMQTADLDLAIEILRTALPENANSYAIAFLAPFVNILSTDFGAMYSRDLCKALTAQFIKLLEHPAVSRWDSSAFQTRFATTLSTTIIRKLGKTIAHENVQAPIGKAIKHWCNSRIEREKFFKAVFPSEVPARRLSPLTWLQEKLRRRTAAAQAGDETAAPAASAQTSDALKTNES